MPKIISFFYKLINYFYLSLFEWNMTSQAKKLHRDGKLKSKWYLRFIKTWKWKGCLISTKNNEYVYIRVINQTRAYMAITESLPGLTMAIETWTASLVKLSSANIQWGLMLCMCFFNTSVTWKNQNEMKIKKSNERIKWEEKAAKKKQKRVEIWYRWNMTLCFSSY